MKTIKETTNLECESCGSKLIEERVIGEFQNEGDFVLRELWCGNPDCKHRFKMRIIEEGFISMS